MRRDDAVFQREQRFGWRNWFWVGYVERGTGDHAIAQSDVQRRLIDDRTARRVDENGGPFHLAQQIGVDQLARFVCQGRVHADEI